MDGTFLFASLSCAPLTSAAELCCDIEAIGADVYCLQNCIASKLKTLPSVLKPTSMSGSTLVVREGTFEVKDQVSVNLLEEVLRRADGITAYRDALPLSTCNLYAVQLAVHITRLRHVSTDQPIIVVNGDVTLPTHLPVADSRVGSTTSADPLDGLRCALWAELQRVLWQANHGGMCAKWACRRVIVSGGLAGWVNSAAYQMVHTPAGAPLTSTPRVVPTVPIAKPRLHPCSGAQSLERTCNFVVSTCELPPGAVVQIVGFTLAAEVEDASLEVAIPYMEDGLLRSSNNSAEVHQVKAELEGQVSGEGAFRRCWRLSTPFPVCCGLSSAVFRLRWAPVECDSGTAYPQLTLLVSGGNDESRDVLCAAPMRSAFALSLTPDEVREDVAILRQAYAKDAVAAKEFESHLRVRAGGGDVADCLAPVATVSDLDEQQRAHTQGKGTLEVFRTGCQSHVFYSYADGLELVEARKIRARDVLKTSSTIHKPLVCTFRFS